jgi:phosphopantothenoylcysteine decarboxylase/phosphopantothenate--cysteine ligase
VDTAGQMRTAVLEHLKSATLIVKAAAVADYHLAEVPKQKMKKTAARLTLDLDPTPDILAEVGQKKGDRLLIGFAAETQNLVEEANRKLRTKNCDMVVGNIVSRSDIGFGSDDNEVVLVLRTGGTVQVPRASKRIVANVILDQALQLRLALHSKAAP